ncbi:HTH-type transcriptional regulator tcmR [Mycobacteroides abscessus]|uniref:TetR/AcrR family transcriptional regulator n=1 Tax=Mycobacteroides abscessus TaxID=36809 RepID=UPI0005E9CED9|nr:TetR/AcrR family transcriptional regulator [Mycobacteroides abscessus]RIS71763.1 TetR family transcriptional regulator [Mycobacteroides abscessus]CPT99242.1 HTH-type transcriptional regulator tcmR [Mycobacteroides abscessus]CPW65709.1 HTH-type transcriptional regulator tcmR [Mycobacteroides abscessus]CPW65855.1 HTH-type transcriptional regulator tcmR [Mycobacteroides abscessus]
MSPSLRTRQRERTLGEIRDAAMTLFCERGYNEVTNDEIADAAGISISTYYRYVRTKQDLLLGPLPAIGADIVARFAESPADTPVATALAQSITVRRSVVSEADLQKWRAAVRTAPELIGDVTAVTPALRRELIAQAAERMNADETADLRPGLIVHIVLAAADYAYHRWLTSDDYTSLHEMMDAALREITGPDTPIASGVAESRGDVLPRRRTTT